MVEDLVKRIGEENLKLYEERGFSYGINLKSEPHYIYLKDSVKDIEIRVHNHMLHKSGEKHLLSISQETHFERIAFKGIMYETRCHRDSKSGRYIMSGLCDFDTILINLSQLIERYHKNQYF